MGGGVALVVTARFRPEAVDGLILVEPAVRRGIRMRLVWDVAFATLALVAPGYSRRLARGVHAEFTAVARERLGLDPRIVRVIRADAYKGLLSLADAASASTRRLRSPTLLLYGRADGIIPLRLFEQAVRDLRPLVTALRYPEAPHLLLQTLNLEPVLDDICAWLDGAPLPAWRAQRADVLGAATGEPGRRAPRAGATGAIRRRGGATGDGMPRGQRGTAALRRLWPSIPLGVVHAPPAAHRSRAAAAVRRRRQPHPRHAAGGPEAGGRRRHRLAWPCCRR